MDDRIVADQLEQLDRVIIAAEDWAKAYKKQPEVLAKLIKLEAKLMRVLRKYFKTLASERVNNYINWYKYQQESVKAFNFDVTVDVQEILDVEYGTLMQVIYEPLQAMLSLGATSAQESYNIDLGISKYSSSLAKAADDYTGELVTGITETTRDRIKQSISTSLRVGDNQQQALARLQEVAGDINRAEMIARTETVRSYNKGITLFGRESNATAKTWEVSSDPCSICEANGLDGSIPFDSQFNSGDDEPPAHPNCRCSMSLEHDYSGANYEPDQTE